MPRKPKFNKQQAIEKVMYCIWENGYEKSSVKAISEMLGITRSSFYHAFGTREQLFKDVLRLYETIDPLEKLFKLSKGNGVRLYITQYFQQLCKERASDKQHKGCLNVNSMSELCSHWSNLADNDFEYMAVNNPIYAQHVPQQEKNSEVDTRVKAQDNSPVVLAVLMRDKLELTNEHFEKLLSWAKEQEELSFEDDVTGLALALTSLNIGINTMSKIVHEEARLWEAAKTTLEGLNLYVD